MNGWLVVSGTICKRHHMTHDGTQIARPDLTAKMSGFIPQNIFRIQIVFLAQSKVCLRREMAQLAGSIPSWLLPKQRSLNQIGAFSIEHQLQPPCRLLTTVKQGGKPDLGLEDPVNLDKTTQCLPGVPHAPGLV